MSSFCICKSYSHFFSKNTCELDILLTRAVNILTTNELVKLTMLWTTGPWSLAVWDNKSWITTSSSGTVIKYCTLTYNYPGMEIPVVLWIFLECVCQQHVNQVHQRAYNMRWLRWNIFLVNRKISTSIMLISKLADNKQVIFFSDIWAGAHHFFQDFFGTWELSQ